MNPFYVYKILLTMDPRIKFILEKAVNNCHNEKMTAALDSLFVELTVRPLQHAYLRRRDPYYYKHYISKYCQYCGCGRPYSSSDDEE